VRDPASDKEWRGAELRELCDELRKLEEVASEVAPVWAQVPIGRMVESWTGTTLPQHWARAGGTDYFFADLRELTDFLELQRATLGGRELKVYEGPDGDVGREEAQVSVCRLTHTDELARLLTLLEARGLAFRGGGHWEVLGGKETQECDDLFALAAAVRKGAQSDIDLQRYKGLGEMDADQLWESTMDPARRTLYQVQTEDAISADAIFTILMSDGVEQRREYIERQALEATNLDV
jgi:DNA gyrase/topoisomerase IV subunit B